MSRIINTCNAPAAVGPYSQGIKTGNQLFISGQIPINPVTGELIQGDIQVQTKTVLENLTVIIEEAGFQLKDVVKCTCFLNNMNDFAAFNKIYSEYFETILPARECVEVARLPKDVGVEISAICIMESPL